MVKIKSISFWVPADCPGCHKRTANQKLCPECTASLLGQDQRPRCQICRQVLNYGICINCKYHNISYDKVISVFDYKGLGQQLVHDYKILKHLSLAGLFADLLVDAVLREKTTELPDIIMPVPAHITSIYERGFSPSAELARLSAKRLKVKYTIDMLWRNQESAKQSTLNYQQRQTAQLNAYACDLLPLSNPHVAIVDDVMTTGATLNIIANILKQAGAAKVHCWVLARTLI